MRVSFLFLFVYATPLVHSAPVGDLISKLPGINFIPNFVQYSGYLKASSKHYFHYWFVYSQNQPAKDPVLLWLNGGPGCSSMLGMLEENGPFRISDNANTVIENVYAWNKIGNVLYIESPAGVGYSYTTDGNSTANDDMTAVDNYHALIDFFKNKFPEFQSNDFYITGESYAGYYLSMLGKLLSQDPLNFPTFKGMAIGNGLLDYPSLVNTLIPMLYNHGMISERLWQVLGSNCCNGTPGNCNYFYWFRHNSSMCFQQIVQVYSTVFYHMDQYNMYATCYIPTKVLADGSTQRGAFYKSFFNFLGLDFVKDILLPVMENNKDITGLPLCAQSNNTLIYMNRPDVQNALHIPSNVHAWSMCNNNLPYHSQYSNMVPQIQTVMQAKKKILIYNGDVDTACNAIGDQLFVSQLNATLLAPKAIWTYAYDIPDTAGLVTRYQGHFVPLDKPREALQMIANFVWNKSYSTPTGLSTKPQPLVGGQCTQMVLSPSYFGGPVLASSLCGQGACTNTQNGAVCSCSPGFSGKLCNNYMITTKTVQIQLCAAYPTPQTKAAGLFFGCPQTYTCVPYQYKCVTTLTCNYPIGYCLPWIHLNTMFPSMRRKLKQMERSS